MINPNGLILIDKDSGMTSFDVIRKLKKIYKTDKIGHTGTLDPLATGLLCVLLGPSVKLSDMLMNGTKTYYAGLRLGIKTDTQDILGQTLMTNSHIPTDNEVFSAINSFVGDYDQLPPMYSAKKKDGKKLYDYARNGETIKRNPNRVYLYSTTIDDKNCKYPDYYFSVKCSKGTYIRTLCDDIGDKLGTYGCMFSLRRTNCNNFDINQAYKLSDLEKMSEEELINALISPRNIFSDFDTVMLNDFCTKLILNGCEIYQYKIGTHLKNDEYIFVYSTDNTLLGIGYVSMYDNGSAIKLKIRL